MSSPQPTLQGLAVRALELSKDMTSFMEANKLTAPSFAANSPDYPQAPELQGPRLELLSVAMDLYQLALGASQFIFLKPPYVSQPLLIVRHG